MAPNLPGRSRVSAISRQALSLFTLSWKSFEDTSKMHGRCCHISTKVVSIVLLHFLLFSLLAFFLIKFIFAVVTPNQRSAVKAVGKHCAWAPAVRGIPSRNWGRGSLMSTVYTSCDSPKNSDMPNISSWGFRTSQTKTSQIASMSHYKTSSRRRLLKIVYDSQIRLRRKNRGKIGLKSCSLAGPKG